MSEGVKSVDKFARVISTIGLLLSCMSIFFAYRPFSLLGEQILFSDAGFDFPTVKIDPLGEFHVMAKIFITNGSTLDTSIIRTYCYIPYRKGGEYGYQTNCNIEFDSKIPVSIKASSSTVINVDAIIPIGEKARKVLLQNVEALQSTYLQDLSAALARQGIDLYDHPSGGGGYGFGQQIKGIFDFLSKDDFDPGFVLQFSTARGNEFTSGRFSIDLGVGD